MGEAFEPTGQCSAQLAFRRHLATASLGTFRN